jgi:DNA-binding transcriptional ArsR family regulator
VYRNWLLAVSGRLGGLDMPLLAALAPVGAHMYGFLTPHPTGPSPAFNDELAVVATVEPDLVRDELKLTAQGRSVPEPLRPLYDDPVAELPHVLDELTRYWYAAVEPFWPQLQTIATADVFYRTEQFAAGGLADVLDNLHPQVAFNADRLLIHQPHHCTQQYRLTGQGIVLVPCAFSWPALLVSCCDVVQPSLTYPPRGIAGIGAGLHTDRHGPLFTLIGRTRTNLLVALEYPKSTTQLAKELNMSAATISQHLKTLKSTDMITSRRQGRLVLYQRTHAATALLTSFHGDGRLASVIR